MQFLGSWDGKCYEENHHIIVIENSSLQLKRYRKNNDDALKFGINASSIPACHLNFIIFQFFKNLLKVPTLKVRIRLIHILLLAMYLRFVL